jgi:FkbM family methyltransferase
VRVSLVERVLRRVRNGLALADGPAAWAGLEWARLRGGTGPRPVRIRFKRGGPVWFRNGTTDYATLVSCFLSGYHRPARPLGPAPVILDVGANVGYTMLDFRYHHPRARVIGVELDARNFALARRNVEGLGMELVHAAVFHRDGEVAYDPGAAFDAFRARDGAGADPAAARVPALTIATLLERLGVVRVDYVKLDIEGAERELFLDGDTGWLDRVDQLSVELHGTLEPGALIALLEGRGFVARASREHWSAVQAWRA